MALAELPSVSVSRRGPRCLGSDPLHTVVWVRDEHDGATRVHLSVVLTDAARLDDADIVVDLSGVTFMDASTIGALVAAGDQLRVLSRSLSVRNPSPPARRLFELCGLTQLIEVPATAPPLGTALGTWVSVPTTDRALDPAQPPVTPEAPVQAPEYARVVPRVEPARSVQRRRARP